MQRPLLIGCCSGAAVMTAKLWVGANTSNSYGGITELIFTPWAMIIGAVPAGIVVGAVYALSPQAFTSDLLAVGLGIGSALICSQYQNMI